MTEPERKPRWSADEKRVARDARRGKESRTDYRNGREDRQFGIAMATGPTMRASGTNSSTAITLRGAPVQYDTPYTVNDQWGSFTEVVRAGALKAILPTSDTKFLYNHDGLTLARTTSGTLVLSDSPKSLNCVATLDPRQTVAADLALAVGRGDINQMSVGFRVGSDVWNDDLSYREIDSFAALFDVSAVCYPASTTTSVELLDVPENLLPDQGGDDGTLGGGGGNGPGLDNQDGTGSRAKRLERVLRIDQDLLRLGRPPLRRVK